MTNPTPPDAPEQSRDGLLARVGKRLHPSMPDDECCEVRVGDLRTLIALSRPSLEPSAVRFELVWIAGARPPMHPDKMRGSEPFASAEEAMARFNRLADDAEFVSLTKVTTYREDVAALQHGEG